MKDNNSNNPNPQTVNIRLVRIQLETLLTERGWTKPGLASRLNVPQGRLMFIMKHPKATVDADLADEIDFIYHHEPADQDEYQSSIRQLIPGLKDPNCDISEAEFQDDLQVLLTHHALIKPDLAEALYLTMVKLNFVLMTAPYESKPYPVSYWARRKARCLRNYYDKQNTGGRHLNYVSQTHNSDAHFYRPFQKEY